MGEKKDESVELFMMFQNVDCGEKLGIECPKLNETDVFMGDDDEGWVRAERSKDVVVANEYEHTQFACGKCKSDD